MATKTIIRKAIAQNQTEFAELLGAREIKSGNLVLIFKDAEVVMPGNWRLTQDLCVGDQVKAYWDEESRFHLEWK